VSFVTETAVYYFNNRIVEYDGTFALDKQASACIAENYAGGSEWTKWDEGRTPRSAPLGRCSTMRAACVGS
jgi:hypothetical protein